MFKKIKELAQQNLDTIQEIRQLLQEWEKSLTAQVNENDLSNEDKLWDELTPQEKKCPSCGAKLIESPVKDIDFVCKQCQKEWCVREHKLYSAADTKEYDAKYDIDEDPHNIISTTI